MQIFTIQISIIQILIFISLHIILFYDQITQARAIERIAEIDRLLNQAQKNKHTERWRCEMRARKAALERQVLEAANKKTKNNEAQFDVQKQGYGSLALIGFPSAGKSSLLNLMTNANSETANYEFTTLTCVSGLLRINGAQFQLLDLPGVLCTQNSTSVAQNLGGAKQILSTARTSSAIIMCLNAPSAEEEREKLEKEIYNAGIRINQKPAQISIEEAKTGGIKVNFTCKQSTLDYDIAKRILQEFDRNNCTCTIKEDITGDQLIDYLCGNRVYMPCIYVVNKIDLVTIESAKWFQYNGYVPISCELKLGIEYLRHVIWNTIRLVRVYTKKKSDKPSLTDPIYLREGDTIKTVVEHIHRDFLKDFLYADVWGTSVQHEKQRCGLQHQVHDGDVVQINFK